MGNRLLAAVFCAAAIVGVGASGALAGEIKGPPYKGAPVAGGVGEPTSAVTKGHASFCAFSGLNDLTRKRVRPQSKRRLLRTGLTERLAMARSCTRRLISCRGN